MIKLIISCSPLFDEVTEYCYEESRDMIAYAKEKNVEVIDLAKEDAIREKVEKALREHPEALFFHSDHGSEDKAWGNDGRPVLDLKNVEILRGRETVQNNCSSAKKLGVEAWRRGCKAYLGYIDVVAFTTDAWETFKEAFLCPIKLRIDGFSWKECLEKTKQRMTELIDELVEGGKTLAASCMRHDRDILVCYNVEPPEPTCGFRRLAVSIFGRVGWGFTRLHGVSILLFGVGLGVFLHDRVVQWVTLGCRLHGLDGGVMMMFVAFVIGFYDFVKTLKRVMSKIVKGDRFG